MSKGKTGRNRVAFARKRPFKDPNATILIVCEGENTEPDYFRRFRVANATIEVVGTGFNTVSLVRRAIELNQRDRYDQVWCVFDKDDFGAGVFDNAIQLAEAKGLHAAWSNQAFEYWLILHFEDHQGGGMPRALYDQKLNAHLAAFGLKYDGRRSKRVTRELFEVLAGMDAGGRKSRQELAIERSVRNLARHGERPPSQKESATTVHRLVEVLLGFKHG
jgi:hypothetical protein